MGMEIQKTTNQPFLITPQNWQQSLETLPVKSDTSPAVILGMNTPQLCQLGKGASGTMAGVAIFRAMIVSLASFLGAPWTKEQCHECGQLAYDECYWFSLAELKQFFTRVKTGKYTSHKNFLPAVFMEFLQEYSEEMKAARYDHFSQQKGKPAIHPDAKPLTDEQMKILREGIEGISENWKTGKEDTEEEFHRIKNDYYRQQLLNRQKEKGHE